MYSVNFYIVKTNGQEIIRDHKSDLQIKIYRLNESLFNAKPDEITLYGIVNNILFAFETVNYKSFGVELMAYALLWYVDYTGQFDIHISSEDPRPYYNLKRA